MIKVWDFKIMTQQEVIAIINEILELTQWPAYRLAEYMRVSEASMSQWRNGHAMPGLYHQLVLQTLLDGLRATDDQKRREWINMLTTAAVVGLGAFLGTLFRNQADEVD